MPTSVIFSYESKDIMLPRLIILLIINHFYFWFATRTIPITHLQFYPR